eukprot:2659671-Prymnesium_polylepis.1
MHSEGTLAWFHLYGLSASAKLIKSEIRGLGKTAARKKLRKHKSEYESEWHGQLLLGLRAERPDDRGVYPSVGKQLTERTMQRTLLPAERIQPELAEYALQAVVLGGTGLTEKAHVEVCVGEYWFKSGMPVVRAGQASFLADQPDSVAPGVLQPKAGDLRRFDLPRERAQVPDVVVYL